MDSERTDLLDLLRKHRGLFRHTVDGLTDEQARERPTASELTVGGLIKHVSAAEAMWADFVRHGAGDTPDVDWENIDWANPPQWLVARQRQFTLLEDETLAQVLAAYDEVAVATDALVGTVDLDASHPLPQAPWFEPGMSWSNRRVFLHIAVETAQHAGHADIIRESIDGQKSMG